MSASASGSLTDPSAPLVDGGGPRGVSASDSYPDSQTSSRDLREGGRWGRRQALKNAALRALIVSLLWLADRAPRRALIALLGAAGALAHRLAGGLRRRAEAQLELAGLEADAARRAELARACFRHAGESLARSLLLRRPGDTEVVVDGASERCLLEALAEGRGVVFVSPHLGPFECLAARVAELCRAAGAPAPAIVVRESYDPALDRHVDAHRERRGLWVIHRGKPGATTRIVRALKQGRAVGFLPDLPGRARRGAVRWFGGEGAIAVGPARIAARAGAPLVLGHLTPRGEAFQLCMRRIEAPESAASQAARAEALSQGLAEALEAAIRQAPAHWLWMAADLRAGRAPTSNARAADDTRISPEVG
ncbi:MAG: lysophospholipid acyltransferase family protein [Polyangiaceae bacterium]|nr:lysophospholipid acyltransferase family protein [Polyangiaceae bacterium]MCW5791517.1 lysophospholipid acyltransferase family protein [Polyangiaceae bacterium]